MIVRAENIAKSFTGSGGTRTAALDGVSLSAAPGALVCLLGANGSGKTTLLKILCGLMPPDHGRIEVAGYDLAQAPDEVRRRTGFSPGEERSFYGRLTGLENLRFFARLRGLDDGRFRDALKRLDQALGLEEILSASYQKTSSGMKQRLSLARALLHEPELLLLDEPTKSLDPTGADALRRHVKDEFLTAARAVIWSTHNVEEAWETGGEIVILGRGRILAQGAPEALLRQSGAASPRDAYRRLTS